MNCKLVKCAVSRKKDKEGSDGLEKELHCQNESKKKAAQSKKFQSDVLIWNKKVPNTEIEKFKKIIEDKYNLQFNTYWDLHNWTVDNYVNFWEEVWTYFGVVFSKPHDEVFVKTGLGFLDNKWFPGAEFNYAENILKIRDNTEALVCLDEEGNLERVTFAQMFEEVKLYAAAFRKHGLQKGDRVACYMSNKKEAVFAMLATTSIGAIWGGPQPYFGARAAANIIQKLEPKLLIIVDRVQDECSGEEYNLIDNLPIIAKSAPTLKCIIIVPSKNEKILEDFSHIPNSCCLVDFLASGKTRDGGIPDIVFEQLPFDHPVSVSFSSGTTGLPKGPVHSAGSILGPLVDFGLHYNLKSGDTIYSFYSMGWSLWNYFVAGLSLGVRLFLHNGSAYTARGGKNIWDIISEHNISFVFLVTSIVDRMEKMKLQPKKFSNFKNLQFLMVGGSPVKLQNHKYLKSILKEDVFIGNLYGASETTGSFSGCDLNSPGFAHEVQVPAFGRAVKVFNEEGLPVIGERGEVVIAKPCPTFPISFWKDDNSELLNRTYFSKFPGVWQQHDEAYINPRTNGIVVLGRSDDTLIQYGERFGSNDIYFAIHDMKEIEDYICVGQNKWNGDSRAVLFLKLSEGQVFTPELRERVAKKIESELWCDCVPELILEVKGIPTLIRDEGNADNIVLKIESELWCDCVPELILEVKGVPYNTNNKRVESLIRKIVGTNQIPEGVNIKNPECLKQYCNIPQIINYEDN